MALPIWDVIRAVNAILAARGHARRFVELRGLAGCHTFVAVDTQQARTLHGWNTTRHPDVGALFAFTRWDEQPDLRATG